MKLVSDLFVQWSFQWSFRTRSPSSAASRRHPHPKGSLSFKVCSSSGHTKWWSSVSVRGPQSVSLVLSPQWSSLVLSLSHWSSHLNDPHWSSVSLSGPLTAPQLVLSGLQLAPPLRPMILSPRWHAITFLIRKEKPTTSVRDKIGTHVRYWPIR